MMYNGWKGRQFKKMHYEHMEFIRIKRKKSTKLRTIKQRWQRWFKKKGGSSVHKSR